MAVDLRAPVPASLDPLADVQVELTAMTFERLLPTVIMSGAGMVIATGSLAHHYHDQALSYLTAGMGIVTLGRAALVFRFPTASVNSMTIRTARRWEIVYAFYTAFYMGGMCASTLLSPRASDPVHLVFCLLGTFVFCNGLSARLGVRPVLVMLQGGPMLACLIFAVLQSRWIMIRWSSLWLVLYAYSFWESNSGKFKITVEQLRSRAWQRNLAEQDALTGLGNRRYFEARLGQLCEGEGAFAIFFIDLDGFKRVNDSFGHAAGDTLLQHVAQRLKRAVRGTDVVARFGGDEFAILLSPECNEDAARVVASRILETVAAPFTIDGNQMNVGSSIGIELSRAPHRSAKLLLSSADAALYQVKQTGKGAIRFAGEEQLESATCVG